MKLFNETEFPGLAKSRVEKFFLSRAESSARWRQPQLVIAIVFAVFYFSIGFGVSWFITMLMAVSFINVFAGYTAHALLEILRRQIAVRESYPK